MNFDFAKQLETSSQEMEIPLKIDQIKSLAAYANLLMKWNRAFNLTAVKEPEDILRRHLLDSLTLVGYLNRHAELERGSVVDVGSGAGLPAVILAVCFPESHITSVDSVGKKSAFVRQAGAQLALPNLHVKHSRIEDIPDLFDIAVCRAFSSLGIFVDLTDHCLKDDGVWIAMKGKMPTEEIRSLKDVAVWRAEQVTVPGLREDRMIIELHRNK